MENSHGRVNGAMVGCECDGAGCDWAATPEAAVGMITTAISAGPVITAAPVPGLALLSTTGRPVGADRHDMATWEGRTPGVARYPECAIFIEC